MPSRFLLISLLLVAGIGIFTSVYFREGGPKIGADILAPDRTAPGGIIFPTDIYTSDPTDEMTAKPSPESSPSPNPSPEPSHDLVVPPPTGLPNFAPTHASNPSASPAASPSPSTAPATPSPKASPVPSPTPTPTPSPIYDPTPAPSVAFSPVVPPSPVIEPLPTPTPPDCVYRPGLFDWFLRLIGRPVKNDCTPIPLPSPSPIIVPDPTPSCPPWKRLFFNWLCDTVPGPKPSPKASPVSTPGAGLKDQIRFIVNLDNRDQEIYRNRDLETIDPVLHRAWLYSYTSKESPALVSVIAKSRIKQAGDSSWYIDFTPSDFEQQTKIPTNTYCVELGFRYKNGSLSYEQAYRANQYIVFSDTSAYDGRLGTFRHIANSGLTQVTGNGFMEPTAQRKTFCPTKQPLR